MALSNRFDLSTAAPSLLLGIIQLFGGLGAFFLGGIQSSRMSAGYMSDELLEIDPLVAGGHSYTSGLVGGLTWYLNPLAWICAYIAIAGLIRVGQYVVHREATAEPLLWLGFAAWDRSRDFLEHRRELNELGPERPDRLQPAADGSLKLISCRRKEHWEVGNSIEIEKQIYRLVGITTAPYGAHRSLVYQLSPQDSRKLIRRLRHYSAKKVVGQREHPLVATPPEVKKR